MSDNVKTFKTVSKKRHTNNSKGGSNYLVRKKFKTVEQYLDVIKDKNCQYQNCRYKMKVK